LAGLQPVRSSALAPPFTGAHQAGRSLRQIATLLGVSKTAVANEVERLGLQRAA